MRVTTNLLAGTGTGDDDTEYVVLGGDHVGVAAARRLRAADYAVTLVAEGSTPDDVDVLRGDPTDVEVLEAAGVPDAATVVVATGDDGRNLLVGSLVRAHFDVPELVVLVGVPDRVDLVAEAGHVPVCATAVLAEALVGEAEERTQTEGTTHAGEAKAGSRIEETGELTRVEGVQEATRDPERPA